MPRKLSEAARKEIAEAVAILKSDGVHIHKTYAAFQKSLTEQPEAKPEEPDTEGQPPPEKPDENTPPVKKSLWWGTRNAD